LAYKFDENKYKSTFEKMYGAGSFDKGLSQAREMGQLKAQAGIAKQQFDNYVSEQKKAQKTAATKAKKKTYTDALTYFNDPSVKESIKKDGAYKIANDIKNDPQKQADIKAQGYSVSDYLDAMYNAVSDGNFVRSVNMASIKVMFPSKLKRKQMGYLIRKSTITRRIKQFHRNKIKNLCFLL
jgi:hypothetical protein